MRTGSFIGAGAALLVASAAVTGCGGGRGAAAPDAKTIVAGTAAKTAAVKSFRFTLDVKGVPPSSTGLSLDHAEGSVIVPDRLDAKIAATFARIPIASELVIVGGSDYLKDPLTGRWRTLDIKTNPVAFFDPHRGVLGVVQGARDIELAGKETVGGAESYHLTGKVKARDASRLLAVKTTSERLVDLDLWVGVKDELLRRVRVTGPVAAAEPANASRTVELSDFGASFQIEAPKTG